MKSSQYVVLTEGGVVHSGPCLLAGIIINDTAGETYLIHDAAANTNCVFKTALSAAGNVIITFPHPISFSVGVFFETASISANATFLIL